jgi:UDP-N-acetylglucosamine 2-epimerase (non-hydrolysing)
MRVLVPFGTRPEIVKLAPVVRALRTAAIEVTVVATGQHYDAELTDVFYDELGIRPDRVGRPQGTPAQRLGAMLTDAVELVAARRPDLVLVLGDTHTVPCYCLAARGERVPVAHLEAGLRSFNETSIEEVNRRVAAATASLHLAPTELAARFLHAEGVPPERVRVVGNPVLDVLRELGVTARPPEARSGVVLTAHRATNVDDPARLEQLVRLALGLARTAGPVSFPLHPRTRDRLQAAGALDRLRVDGIELCPPLPYRDMVSRIARARVVVTDSGGLQEEAAWLGIPVVVLRRSTPRWEAVAAGTSVLTGMDAERALAATLELAAPDAQARVAATPCPYGDGHTAARVAALLTDPASAALLGLEEPDYVGKPPPT